MSNHLTTLRKSCNDECVESEKRTLKIQYPYSAQPPASLLKASRIVEVSFPNSRVNVFRIVTEDYELIIKMKNLSNSTEVEHVKDLGRTLAAFLQSVEPGQVGNINGLTLTLAKKNGLAKVDIIEEGENVSNDVKCLCPGWYKVVLPEVFIDFFTD